MTPRIRQIQGPNNVIREIPPSVITEIRPPVIRTPAPPVVRGISPPVVRVPNPQIEYPQIQVPRPVPQPPEEREEESAPPVREPQETNEETPTDTRDLPNTPSVPSTPQVPQVPTQTPTIDIGGTQIPIPEAGPLVAAGSLAVVTTVVTLGATIVVGQVKNAVEPMLRKAMMQRPKLDANGRKKKIKVKRVKPVLHFIMEEDGEVQVIEYSQNGMKILDGNIANLEQYLRYQVDINSLYEFDNKLIIDDPLKSKFTKEGQKRFKSYFATPKTIAKKLGAKFSF